MRFLSGYLLSKHADLRGVVTNAAIVHVNDVVLEIVCGIRAGYDLKFSVDMIGRCICKTETRSLCGDEYYPYTEPSNWATTTVPLYLLIRRP